MIGTAMQRAAAFLDENPPLFPGLLATAFNRQGLLGAYGLAGIPGGIVGGGDELLRIFPGTDWLELRTLTGHGQR